MLILVSMLMDAMRVLEEANLGAWVHPLPTADEGADVLVEVELDGLRRIFAATLKSRAPYPSEIARMEAFRSWLAQLGSPLLVAPYVSRPLAVELSESGWSWVDTTGNFDLRAPQLRAKQRLNSVPPKRLTSQLPQGPGALGITRFLINKWENDRPIGPEELSQIAHVTQPRATQVLTKLRELRLVRGKGRDWFPDREGLLDAFLGQYRGSGGSERRYFSLDPLLDVARQLTRLAEERDLQLKISADVGPDLIVPWRKPTHLIAYVSQPTMIDLDWVEARSSEDANVLLRLPADRSILQTRGIDQVDDEEIPLADPTQMIWDLHDLGGSDRSEAADNLRKWLFQK